MQSNMEEIFRGEESTRGERCTVPEYDVQDVSSKTFHVGSLGTLWREVLLLRDLALEEEEEVDAEEEELAVVEELGCNAEIAAELRVVCSIDTLKYENEDKAEPEIIPEDTRLVTLGIRKKMQERRDETIMIDRICRQEKFNYAWESHAEGKKPQNPSNLVNEGELVLTLNIIYPIIFEKHKEHKPYQRVMVLGSQKLTELRDFIACVSDLQVGGEFSNTPDLVPENISKDLFKSAFFYFNGVFYNDMRYPECRDLSRMIIEWSESLDRGYGRLQSTHMDDHTFNDLNIKVGFPYLYCHQGDCEHLVLITDIRLIHKDDCLDRTMYPLVTKKPWILTRKCFVCKMYIARWVTNEDSLAPQDPCLFCDVCFRMLHYDEEGNKLGSFLCYPYLDPGTFN
ncbi:snRNA-activating protein complex subunit 3 [Lissotriton helveticus]